MSCKLYTIISSCPVPIGEHGSMLFELADNEHYCCSLMEPMEGVAILVPELPDGSDGEPTHSQIVTFACDFSAGDKVWLDPGSENFIDEPVL